MQAYYVEYVAIKILFPDWNKLCVHFLAFLEDDDDLNAVLCEFDAVIEDFTSPVEKRHFRYDEHLKTMKRRSSASVSDSGISDSESEYASKKLDLTCHYSRSLIAAHVLVSWGHYLSASRLKLRSLSYKLHAEYCIILSNLIWAHTRPQRAAGFQLSPFFINVHECFRIHI